MDPELFRSANRTWRILLIAALVVTIKGMA
jgi:hypothetical protein